MELGALLWAIISEREEGSKRNEMMSLISPTAKRIVDRPDQLKSDPFAGTQQQ